MFSLSSLIQAYIRQNILCTTIECCVRSKADNTARILQEKVLLRFASSQKRRQNGKALTRLTAKRSTYTVTTSSLHSRPSASRLPLQTQLKARLKWPSIENRRTLSETLWFQQITTSKRLQNTSHSWKLEKLQINWSKRLAVMRNPDLRKSFKRSESQGHVPPV